MLCESSSEVWLRFTFLLYSVFNTFCWLWNEPLNKLPLAMKHIVWVFSGTQWQLQVWDWNSAGRAQGKFVGAGTEKKFNPCGCGAGWNFAGWERTKNFNPRRILICSYWRYFEAEKWLLLLWKRNLESGFCGRCLDHLYIIMCSIEPLISMVSNKKQVHVVLLKVGFISALCLCSSCRIGEVADHGSCVSLLIGRRMITLCLEFQTHICVNDVKSISW